MRPPARSKTEFEQVKVDEWIPGIVEDIKYEMERKSMWEGKERVGPMVRFKFKLDGYNFPHYSRWMSFSTGEKSNLYKKYLMPLVDRAEPEMDFDLDALKGMQVKIMFSQNGDFQNVEMIRPIGAKIPATAEPLEPAGEETIPF